MKLKEGSKNKILNKYSKGKYSWNDYLKIKHWFSSIHEQPEIRQYLNTEWDELNSEVQSNKNSLKHIFDKIEYQILLERYRNSEKTRWLNLVSKAASILFIPLLVFFAWYYINTPANNTNTAWAEIHSPQGARTQFSLPDGSSGWLNSGSTLKYNISFSTDRTVELTGEAFFDVVHNNSVFKVCSGDIDISVLGTKFNVMAYPDIDFNEVVLEKGQVRVDGKTSHFSKTLSPGQKLKFLPGENKIRVNEVDTEPYIAWKDGFLILDNEPLAQAVGRIERWYNVEIDIKDKALKNYRFKATFQEEPLEEVLRLLAVSTPIQYTIDKRTASSNSLYAKKRITLKLK